MNKLGVMVCTNSAIDYVTHDEPIDVIRSMVIVGDEEYIDYEELTANQFYDMLSNDKTLFPRTAMPSTGTMIEHYEHFRDQGCDEILFVTISSNMSGIYENALVAANMTEGVHVTVFDSKTVGYIEAKMAIDAYRMAQKGKSLEAILEHLRFLRDNNRIYFAVSDLSYLVKNGRLTNAAGFFADVLKIKPLLKIDDEGKVVTVEKIRTFKKALNRVIDLFLEETKGKDYEAFIIHANNPEGVAHVRKRLAEERPDLKNINDYPLTPAVGAHSGPKAMTVGYVLNP